MKKIALFILFVFLSVMTNDLLAQNQNDMFNEKRSTRRVWRKWRKDKDAYNPYLKKKNKDKPSARIAKGNRKDLRQQKRINRKQMRRSKKTIKKHSGVH